jgi:hypothetical protein
MDEISRGMATAALTLQSALLQALINKGALTHGEALDVVEKSLDAVVLGAHDGEAEAVAEVTHACQKGYSKTGPDGPALRVAFGPAHQAGQDDLLLDDGDVEGAAVWRMIMGMIAECSATEPGEGAIEQCGGRRTMAAIKEL